MPRRTAVGIAAIQRPLLVAIPARTLVDRISSSSSGFTSSSRRLGHRSESDIEKTWDEPDLITARAHARGCRVYNVDPESNERCNPASDIDGPTPVACPVVRVHRSLAIDRVRGQPVDGQRGVTSGCRRTAARARTDWHHRREAF